MKQIIEGSTKLIVHEGLPTKKMEVFFNPAKSFDRSLSVEIIKELKPKHCLDLLSGGGARGLRLMVEAGITGMTFNDLNPQAVKLLKKNLKLNKLKARVFNKESNQLLYDLGEYFDFIDLDPFGSPNPYLESAIKFTQRHGVLAVTATDTAALNGSKPKACFRKYHSINQRHPFMKETGLRILIKHVVEKGAENDFSIKPIAAHSTAHYYRAYFLKELGAKRTDELLNEIKVIYYCPKCGHRGYEQCIHKECIKLGPIFTGPINPLKISPYHKEDDYSPWHYSTIEFNYKQEPKMDEILKKHDGIRVHYEPKAFKTNLFLKRKA